MVWNNNQQTHGAPGKISQPPQPPHLCARKEDLPRIHHDSADFPALRRATQRGNTQEPKRAFGVHMIKSQTSNSPSEKKCVRTNPCIVKLHSGCALEWLR